MIGRFFRFIWCWGIFGEKLDFVFFDKFYYLLYYKFCGIYFFVFLEVVDRVDVLGRKCSFFVN